MITAALTATAGALLTWPPTTSSPRLQALQPVHTRRRPWRRPNPAVLIATAAIVALAVFGPGPAIAITIAGITGRAQWLARGRARDRLAAVESLADAIHGVVAELRAGAQPVAAAEAAALDAKPPANAVLNAIAATARLDGDLAPILQRCTTETPIPVPALKPMITAWTLSRTQGLPLADVLDAVRADITGQLRFARRVQARMAGPQASGTVLAALPALGVLLGEAMGAHPLHILLTNPLGQTLLATGTALMCLGLHWINQLTRKAALP